MHYSLDLVALDGNWLLCDKESQPPQPIAVVDYACGRQVEYDVVEYDTKKLLRGTWQEADLSTAIAGVASKLIWLATEPEDAHRICVTSHHSYWTLDLKPAEHPKSIVSFKRLHTSTAQ